MESVTVFTLVFGAAKFAPTTARPMVLAMSRLFFLLWIVATALGAADVRFAEPVVVGQLTAPPRKETSGLAASRRTAELFWTHDDSGGAAALYAVTATGKFVGALQIAGVKNDDWEDLASYELAGKSWLLIADTGDNDAKRSSVALHIVEEPSLEQLQVRGGATARPTRTLRVRYEDGPRDCESVAVDVPGRAVYLLTKREEVPRLYRLDLEPANANAIIIARHVAQVAHVPQPTKSERKQKGYQGKRHGQVTAMDIAADGSAAVVLSYGNLLYFPRASGESWATALGRAPQILPPPRLGQAEAVCFSAAGNHLYVAAEDDTALLRYERW
jgi:hypothetical protein